MGKSTREATQRKDATNQVGGLRSKVCKNKSKSVATHCKTNKIKGSSHQDLQNVSVVGGRKSKLELQRITVIHEKGKSASLKKKTKDLVKLHEVHMKKKKEIRLQKCCAKRDDISPGWELDPTSSDVKPTDTVRTTSRRRNGVSISETAKETGKASVRDSPCITIVDLSPGYRTGTCQAVRLPLTQSCAGRRNSHSKKQLSSLKCSNNDSLIGNTSDKSLIPPLKDVIELLSKKSPAEYRPMQSVYVVDLGNQQVRDSNSSGKKAKVKLTKGSTHFRDSLGAWKQGAGDIQRDQNDIVKRKSEFVTSNKEAVKSKSKKRKLSASKALKGKKSEYRELDTPTDKIDHKDDEDINSSTPRKGTVKKKEQKEEKGGPEVHQSVKSGMQRKEEMPKEEHKDEPNTDGIPEEAIFGKSDFNQVAARGGEELSQDPVGTLHGDDTPSGQELNGTTENGQVSSNNNGGSSGSPFEEGEDEEERMDSIEEQLLQDGSSIDRQPESQPSFRIIKLQNSDQCLVLIPHSCRLGFHGKVLVRAIHGSIKIVGFPVSAATDHRYHPLYSPNSSCALCLETTGGQEDGLDDNSMLGKDVNAFLSAEGETATAKALECAKDLGNFAVALSFKRMPVDSAVEYVERFPGFGTLFSSPENKEYTQQYEAWKPNLEAAAAVGFQPITPTTPGTVFSTLPGYQSVDQAIHQWLNATAVAPVVLLCGWKNVGKSTLCRYLSNSLIASADGVCYLECDMAQTEFTPPGMLSLQHITQPILGPPFTHSRTPEKMCFYGDVNVRADPESYLQMIQYLFQQYQTTFRQKPLVINTMGWMQGLGLQLLIDIIHITRPTHIVQLWSSVQPRTIPRITSEFLGQTSGWWYRPEEETDGTDEEGTDGTFHPEVLEVDVPNVGDQGGTKYKASDHRTMALLASLSDLQPTPLPLVPVALSSLTPLVLPWRCVAVHVTNGHVPLRQVMYALNGSIVGLCQADPAEMLRVSEDLPKVFKATPVCQCLGLGIIRGIDPVQKVFYILTGLSQHALQEVNTLLKGSLTLPQPLLTQGHQVADVPYVSREFSSVIIGSGAIKVRRNIKQRGR